MTIPSTSGATDTTGILPNVTSSSSSSSVVGGQLGKDAFLQLLVASMRYQDPSKPTDSQAYMAQLAQFSQVEKLDTLNTSQAEASLWQRAVAGQGMIGHQVTGTSATGDTVTGVVKSVTLGSSGPRLQLADGTTLAVTDVTSVADADGAPAPGA